MKKNKLARGLCLTILVAFCGGGVAHAAGTSSQNPMSNGDPIQSHNSRHKTPHADRKAAAARLRVTTQTARADDMARQVSEHGRSHHGHNGGAK